MTRPSRGTCVELLRPASGRMAVSGISVVSGPVDGYLALALAMLGEREEATALAERAEALATPVADDGLPAVVRRWSGTGWGSSGSAPPDMQSGARRPRVVLTDPLTRDDCMFVESLRPRPQAQSRAPPSP